MRWMTDVVEQKAIARKCFMPIIKERLHAEALYKSQGRMDEWKRIKAKDSSKWSRLVFIAHCANELKFNG